MLEVNDLMVFYENALALNNLSLKVERGEFVAVLGSNSAGKTTLMNAIAGLVEDMRVKEQRKGGVRITVLGEMLFEGEDILRARPKQRVKKGIILTRERHPIFKESDIVENLKIAGCLQKARSVEASIDRVFSILPHLKNLKGRKAGFCSGGEQQMLIIGMALVAQPRLLLLDEPLLGLSPAIQAHLVATIREINRSGITILITEQFARPVLPFIQRGYIVEHGMLTLSGTGAELMDNPEVKSAYFGI